MNEDVQLSGKVYYGLTNIAKEPIVVGRQNCEPKPQIILRGAGIQTKHASFKIRPNGLIDIFVDSQDAFENTLVNGQRLQTKVSLQEWS